ncbi:hypothetical protein [Cysteiniphilum sp. QT6929]|uniref:hypothetical protein n=1 Tax=Cysteiniphilum sp. QT6929 TaxID=2975055 RepID=UPI0024B34B8E|nr:hypothetical protein [Cysteiniphilum sp. QT6929]WHN66784.1 hypothetical protein NYP54_11570 [Cysteiniphilum sp. QT6929]
MLFKNKANRAEITINNRNLHCSGICGYKKRQPYCDAFKLSLLRNINTNGMTKKEKERINKEVNESRKDIANYFDTVDQIYHADIAKYYHDKYMIKFVKTLQDSVLKEDLMRAIKKLGDSEIQEIPSNHNMVNSVITSYIDSNLVNYHYHRFNRELLWHTAAHIYFSRLKGYAYTGKYKVLFGSLNFGNQFNLTGCNDQTAELTLPHTYKTEVLGSGLEVIDNKYLTISLKAYDSIIKDCQMYQAELLKVKKIFRDSEIEQAYIAKLDNQVLIAKSHEQLMRKVIKAKESAKDNGSQPQNIPSNTIVA